MQRFISSGFVTCAVFALAPLRAQSRPSSDDITAATAALEKLAAAMHDVKVLRADYEQSQASLLTQKPVISKGCMWLRRDPACLLLQVREPRAAVIRSDPGSHQIYHPDTKKAERWLFEKSELASALFGSFTADVSALGKAFEIVGWSPAERVSVVKLVPQRKEVAAFVAHLELTLDNKDGVLVGVAHTNADGEETRLSFSNVEVNPSVEDPAALFDAPLPADVKVSVSRVPAPAKR